MKKYILSAAVAEKKLRRMALEIAERNYDEPQLVLIGIKDHGTVIAKKISDQSLHLLCCIRLGGN